jgi:Lysylphosphatidylglycerol synthase TM region
MISGLPYKTKQFFFVFIKLSIVAGATYFIYEKLANNQKIDFSVFVDFLTKNDVFSTKNVLFLLFLTIFNWFFEILKWKNLVCYVKYISFFEAFKQSLASHTASLFTPNRIGDYGAKAIYFKPELRKRIVLLNLISNMAQMCATLVFGIIGFLLFISKYDVDISYYRILRAFALIVVIIAMFAFGISYKKLNIKGFSLSKIKVFIKNIPAKIHIKNGLFSILRYLVFSFQFYYLLLIFGIDIHYFNAMVIITTMYLFVSIIPTIFVFDVVVKGSVALYLFSFVGVDELIILCITMLMWLLNFVLPSVFGSFYILNFDYYKEIETTPDF